MRAPDDGSRLATPLLIGKGSFMIPCAVPIHSTGPLPGPVVSCIALMSLTLTALSPVQAAEIRVGMVGIDTSHAPAFTKLMNDSTAKGHTPGTRVVAAVRGGSRDIPSSWDRVEGYVKELTQTYGVEFVPTVEELCKKVDAVMIESVDGRPHLDQARPVFAAGKRLFIDKPLAGSLKDAIEIYRLGKKHNVGWFTSSSYRYYLSMAELKRATIGSIRSAISYGPAHKEPHHPDFYWYGIHPAEGLYTVLGMGCQSVTRVATEDTDVVSGTWTDGRTGVLIGLRTGSTPHKVTLFGTKGVAEQKGSGDYAPLVAEIVRFFQTGVVPIPPEETIELMAFMEAADESKRQGGKPVKIEEVLRANGWRFGAE